MYKWARYDMWNIRGDLKYPQKPTKQNEIYEDLFPDTVLNK